ncbi:MAG TPA: hypothetical protein VHC98_03750 [Candidatus Saccharimonadales bacterium]|nr:hypothetical protein [Candidatus Saccharimonadales bacterium]
MRSLAAWHRTTWGPAVSAAALLALAYGLACLAIDRGSLWWYLLTLLALIAGLRQTVGFIRNIMHGNKTSAA